MMTATIAPLPSLANFRDLGGLRTDDGRRVVAGVVYRSDAPFALDDFERRYIAAVLGIRTAIDLRSDYEVRHIGPVALAEDGVEVVRMPILSGSMEAMATSGPKDLAAITAAVAFDATTDVARVISRLARRSALPALVFCTAGKDRTGVTMAFLLSVLGVRREEIVEDYARSAGTMVAMLDRIADRVGRDRMPLIPEAMFDAPAVLIEGVLDEVDRRGGAAAMLAGAGLSPQSLGVLESTLLTA